MFTSQLNEFCFPLPPLKEQTAIVAEIETRYSIAEDAGVRLQTNLKRGTRLRQSILKRAFEGKLVPQDPKDEPADKLLERLKQARISNSPGTNGVSKSARRRVSFGKPRSDFPAENQA